MKTVITPSQAEEALDALKSIKIRTNISRAGYAVAKNILILSRVTRDFIKYRDAERAAAYPNGEKPEPASDKFAELSAKVGAKANEGVEVTLLKIKLSELFSVAALEDVTVLPAIDCMLDDDLDLDAIPAVK